MLHLRVCFTRRQVTVGKNPVAEVRGANGYSQVTDTYAVSITAEKLAQQPGAFGLTHVIEKDGAASGEAVPKAVYLLITLCCVNNDGRVSIGTGHELKLPGMLRKQDTLLRRSDPSLSHNSGSAILPGTVFRRPVAADKQDGDKQHNEPFHFPVFFW